MGDIESKGFFRKEVEDYTKVRLDGGIVVIQEIKYNILLIFLSILMLTFVIFIATASFNRFETVHGLVISSSSVLKVYPPKSALLKSMLVKEKDVVSKGDKLAIFRPNLTELDGNSNKELEKLEIISQINNLNSQLKTIKEEIEIQEKNLLAEKDRLESAVLRQNEKIVIQERNLSLDESILEKKISLLKDNSIAELDVFSSEKSVLLNKLNLKDLIASTYEAKFLLTKVDNDLAALPNILLSKTLKIENDISVLKRQLISIQNDIEFVVFASHSGVISNILNQEGENVSEKYPLFTILPEDSEFILELYVPSRAIGFITEGMNVRARFKAFPVQIYGDLKARIYEISDTMLFPSEWPNPTGLQQPVYRIRAKLEQQHFIAEDEMINLRPGLSVEADIVLEQNTIAEVFFEPIIKQIKVF